MKMLDVNVLAYAFHQEAQAHAFYRDWLNDLLRSDESFAIPELVLCSFVRVVTLPRPWDHPASTAEALTFCASLTSAPRCLVVRPSDRHWQTFERLCRESGARANLITDAYLAAFAVDGDAEWVTADRDFAGFPGLTWRLLPENRTRKNPRQQS